MVNSSSLIGCKLCLGCSSYITVVQANIARPSCSPWSGPNLLSLRIIEFLTQLYPGHHVSNRHRIHLGGFKARRPLILYLDGWPPRKTMLCKPGSVHRCGLKSLTARLLLPLSRSHGHKWINQPFWTTLLVLIIRERVLSSQFLCSHNSNCDGINSPQLPFI